MSSQDIVENMARWVSSFSEDTSKNICSLYDEQASLWATLSPIKRDSAALIKDYFNQIFKYPNRYVEITDSNIRLFGDVAICNGQYTFSWFNEGVKVITAARFSFVYINKGGRWFIIEHHSSFIPVVA
ncbi:MAG: hypothetical protein ACI8Y3_000707 [Paraglaciecola sp.]